MTSLKYHRLPCVTVEEHQLLAFQISIIVVNAVKRLQFCIGIITKTIIINMLISYVKKVKYIM